MSKEPVALVVFDLDGTLARSKSKLDDEMGALLAALLRTVPVAVMSGADFSQFEKQLLPNVPHDADLTRLSILPTCGTRYYRYDGGWRELYAHNLDDGQKRRIEDALEAAIAETHTDVPRTWGPTIEDRGSQITYSALGQEAPLEAKEPWDPDFAKRHKIKAVLDRSLSDFSVRLGGATSIDVTLPGVDKAYGMGQLRDVLKIDIAKMLFIGDALFPGGNDAPVRDTDATCIQVRDPEETKRVVETIIACAPGVGPAKATATT